MFEKSIIILENPLLYAWFILLRNNKAETENCFSFEMLSSLVKKQALISWSGKRFEDLIIHLVYKQWKTFQPLYISAFLELMRRQN